MAITTPDRSAKIDELRSLRERLTELEAELYTRDIPEVAAEVPYANAAQWRPEGFYLAYHLIAGVVLGSLGAIASLLFNVVGATVVGLFPLQIIRVYLTFPLGADALALNSGLALGVGCCLYMATGAIYGMVFHYILSRYYMEADFQRRFVAVTAMALILWLVNFYAILSWLQPMLFGGNWIVAQIPFYVAAATHLVFGWSVVLLAEFGQFDSQWRARLS